MFRSAKSARFWQHLRKMCQSHYLTISPPGLIFWEMLSNAFPLTSCNRYTLFLLLLEYHANKTSCSIFCNRNTLFLIPINQITQTKLSLYITWIWWWRWLPWPPGRPSPSSGTRCCFFVACPWLCQDTCVRVLEMSNASGKLQIIACSGEEDHLNTLNFGWGWYEMG